MTSNLNHRLAQARMQDMRRSAERQRAAAARPRVQDPFPTVLHSRRLGRLVRIVRASPGPSA